MDPNANIVEQTALLDSTSRYDRARLRELRVALAEWLNKGGFSPDWAKYPGTRTAFQKWIRNRAKFQDLYR